MRQTENAEISVKINICGSTCVVRVLDQACGIESGGTEPPWENSAN